MGRVKNKRRVKLTHGIPHDPIDGKCMKFGSDNWYPGEGYQLVMDSDARKARRIEVQLI